MLKITSQSAVPVLSGTASQPFTPPPILNALLYLRIPLFNGSLTKTWSSASFWFTVSISTSPLFISLPSLVSTWALKPPLPGWTSLSCDKSESFIVVPSGVYNGNLLCVPPPAIVPVPAGAQVLSPLKNVLALGEPVALNVEITDGVVVGFVTLVLINWEVPPDTLVTVPIPIVDASLYPTNPLESTTRILGAELFTARVFKVTTPSFIKLPSLVRFCCL